MRKIEGAVTLVMDALRESELPMIAFSGGKDSTVVLHLVRSIDPSVPAYFTNTGVEHPETLRFCRTIENLTTLKPDTTFWKLVDKHGWPKIKSKAKSHGNACCRHLKEKPGDKYHAERGTDLVFTGLTASESHQRKLTFRRLGPYYYAKTLGNWRCHPIWDWTEDEVWDYIRDNELPYNEIYDKGAKRCGCAPCTAYLNWKRQLANDNPKLLRVVLRKQKQCQLVFDCHGNLKI